MTGIEGAPIAEGLLAPNTCHNLLIYLVLTTQQNHVLYEMSVKERILKPSTELSYAVD